MLTRPLLLIGLGLAACGADDRATRGTYRSPDSATALAKRVSAAAERGAVSTPCGHANPHRPTELILVTSRACLSCRGIGHLVRGASRGRPGGMPLVVIPAADSAEACRFMKAERVRNEVIAVSEDIFSGEAVGTTVIVASLDSTGRLRSAVFGRDAVDLLPRIDSMRRGS
jgi:hypothetical protein